MRFRVGAIWVGCVGLIFGAFGAEATVRFDAVEHEVEAFLMGIDGATSTEFGTFQASVAFPGDGPPTAAIDATVTDADAVHVVDLDITAFGTAFAGTESGGALARTTLDFEVLDPSFLRLHGELVHEWDPFNFLPQSGRSFVELQREGRTVLRRQTGDITDFEASAFASEVELAELEALTPGSYRLVIEAEGGAGADQTLSGSADVAFEFVDLPGDYDGSGRVEQGDLNLVLLNWGLDPQQLPDGQVPGWVSDRPQGTVAQDELNRVLEAWGAAAAPDFRGFAIPEPATGVGIFVAGCVAVRRRRPYRSGLCH